MGLKQNLKQILIKKQHKKYESELSRKKMSYEDWVRKQENQIKVDNVIVSEGIKCQKIEIFGSRNEGIKNENEGLMTKNDVCCRSFEVRKKGKEEEEKFTFLELPMEKSAAVKEESLAALLKDKNADVILFVQSEGELSPFTLPLLYQKFQENKNIVLIYGDEDVQSQGQREKPWFKPDFSPDTFLSQFYFGSLVAIRAEAVWEAVTAQVAETGQREAVPETAAAPAGRKTEGHVLYRLCESVIRNADGFSLHQGLTCQEPVCHISEILFHTKKEGYEIVKDWHITSLQEKTEIAEEEKPLISVIIPSKDNPRVLFTCIHSFLEKTATEYSYEILVIDNGSSQENKAIIQAEADRWNREETKAGSRCRRMVYHYEPMVFNFSRMCNLGASLSEGKLLLFLNDDMEIVQPDWLNRLAEKALLPYVGGVGAKLLYPDSDVIQHAGITNLRVGPAHKLQFLHDSENYYYGKNRGVHNMLAVTGACLMMKREIFDQVGGFAEQLAVAFNDVDLCYSIYEAGYYNVVRNDVVLYHHESLSRGKDGESEEKQQRLLREKDILYERHQEIYGKDPFYHKYLTTDMLEAEYTPAVRYQVTLEMPWAEVTKENRLQGDIREDGCVVIGMEAAMDIYKWKYGVEPGKGKKEPLPEEMGYYFQGYSFVIGSDNACYKKTLLLEEKKSGQIIKVPLDIRYRPDIRKNLEDQVNVDLTGYAAKVRLADIPAGEYRFGMLAQDQCSRLKLVNFSSWVLKVDR